MILNRLANFDFAGRAFGFTYDSLGRRLSLTRPNAVNTTYTYDPLSRLLSALHKKSTTTLDGATYTYDNAGNRLTKQDNRTSATSNYVYDNIYQLKTVTGGSTESYTYDAVGNRLTSPQVTGYTYNSSNQLISHSTATYTYDNNGNALTRVDASGTTTYNWDFENRLSSVVLPGTGGTVSFVYDPFGRRIKKAKSTTTIYVYDGADILQEVSSTGAVNVVYTMGPGIDQPLAQRRGTTNAFYEADGLGTITSITTSAGAIGNTYTYGSYGKSNASSGTIVNTLRYTARELDSETNLYNYRARYYDQNIGRFLSEDPIGFGGGINYYRYVQNNPPLLIDPFGLSSMTFDRASGSLTLYDKDGNVVVVCTAANKTTKSSNGPWPNGSYPFLRHKNHSADPNGPYGSYGIDLFDVPGRTGMGVHSGRADSGGPSHPTLGCVRTTDDCMKQITDWQTQDPMTTITIQ